MKVLIDFTQIPIEKVGVGMYAINTFAKIFAAQGSNIAYFAVIQSDDSDFDRLDSDSVKLIKVNSMLFRNFLLRFLLEQIYLPFLILKYKIDVIHSLHYSFPLLKFGAKRVITIHDLTFFFYPHLHTFIKRHYFKFFIRLSTLGKNNLVCVSKSTAADLQYKFKTKRLNINVTPLAKNNHPEYEDFNHVSQLFSLPTEYLLFIGTLEPRKNLVAFIRAYAKLPEDYPFKLVIVGKRGWFYQSIFDIVNTLDLSEKVIFTDFVSESQKNAILKNAAIFIYPSLYEGFGLPVLEALSEGIPTITSNISSMPEVAGDAALMVDPNNIDEIADAILRLTYDQTLRHSLSRKAKERAKLFDWQTTAELTIRIYNQSNDHHQHSSL